MMKQLKALWQKRKTTPSAKALSLQTRYNDRISIDDKRRFKIFLSELIGRMKAYKDSGQDCIIVELPADLDNMRELFFNFFSRKGYDIAPQSFLGTKYKNFYFIGWRDKF